MTSSKVSVIIVNWNGKKWLDKCLKSVFRQSYSNLEVILVDNGSSDGSLEFVSEKYPQTKLVALDKNYGFAKANNEGVKVSKGDIIFYLNNDTQVSTNLIADCVKIFDEPKVGTVQPKIVLMNDPETTDLVGAYWTWTTFLFYFGLRKKANSKKYNKPLKVFTNKGAAMFVRKKLLDKIGGFDEDFWCYYEETDLCHRAWLSGYECWYTPVSRCVHANGGTSLMFENSFIQFHNFKNKLQSFIKNFETQNLIKIIPVFVMCIVGLSFVFLFRGEVNKFLSIYKALFWNIKNIDKTLKKRKEVQSLRRKRDSKYLPEISRNVSLPQIVTLLSR